MPCPAHACVDAYLGRRRRAGSCKKCNHAVELRFYVRKRWCLRREQGARGMLAVDRCIRAREHDWHEHACAQLAARDSVENARCIAHAHRDGCTCSHLLPIKARARARQLRAQDK
eukprot:6199770-Pleurochrysis_carterae.AAC.12